MKEETRENKIVAPSENDRFSAAHECLHHIFEYQTARTPDALAVSLGTRHLTYAEINQSANQLAHRLIKLGVGPETPVALCLDRSFEMIVAILAVLKAGGAYVPLDLAYPKDRLAFMLSDSQAPILLTQPGLMESLPKNSANVISLSSDWKMFSGEPTDNPVTKTSGENVAYVIFTSGSTGKPKGVVVTHENVVRLFSQTEHWFHFDHKDVWTLFHSYAFDFSVWEIWGALLFGGRLVVVPYLVSRSPEEFYQLLGREEVTVLNQTPSAFRQLIWADANAKTKHELHLRYVIFGGEALELQSLKPWFDLHGDDQPLLINMYGITETTVHVTYRPIKQIDLTTGAGSVIGVPIPDLTIHLLDEHRRPVPPCVAGEMFVGGGGVARGYLNRPELTRERFIPDPFSTAPNARLYRTGDLAQYHSNGELEYLGRIDQQVKIRGFRIEPGEIETALNRHPAIRESIVIAHGDSDGDKRLISYLVAKDNLSSTELRQFLGKTIPDYMIPSAFMFLESLPLTPNGKVDRKALPLPGAARPSINAEYVAPQTPMELAIAEIWSEIFRIEKIGANDNFFDLGGHSLLAVQLLVRIRERQGVELPLQALFDSPTVQQLAETTLKALLAEESAGELAEVLKDLSQLSDEEAKQYLVSEN